MKQGTQLMYREYARYYDLIYSTKDYKKESTELLRKIKKFKKTKGNDLLEVACGSGKHIAYFKKQYRCTGIDTNQGILNIARKKNSDVAFVRQDMTKLSLNKQFDVITCLFSSIGYVKTHTQLQETFNRFAKHLKTGGVLIVEPWFSKEIFTVGSPHMGTYENDEIKIARMNVSKVRGDLSIMNMHWLVAEKNKDVIYFIDKHEMLMTPIPVMLAMMKKAGLTAIYIKNSQKIRGFLIGVKH